MLLHLQLPRMLISDFRYRPLRHAMCDLAVTIEEQRLGDQPAPTAGQSFWAPITLLGVRAWVIMIHLRREGNIQWID
jgi:hypothetical protein